MISLPAALAFLALGAEPELQWGLAFQAPPSCIQTAELAAEVEHKLQRPLFGARADLRVEGQVKPAAAPARWMARFSLVDASGRLLGTREVTSALADCRAFDASLVLVVSVMIDAQLKLRGPAPPPSPEVTPALPPLPPRVAPQGDDFGRLLRRERSGIYLGGFGIEQHTFYGMVARPDLQETLGDRRLLRGLVIAGGIALMIAGGALVVADRVGRPTTSELLYSGLITGLTGVAALIIGLVLPTHPTTDEEDDRLIEEWNLHQRTATTQRRSLSPVGREGRGTETTAAGAFE